MSSASPVAAVNRSRKRVLVGIEQPASGMADDHDLVGPEQLLADDQRADDVLGGEPARVPDDVGFAGPQPEGGLDVEPRVHAGEDRQAAQRGGRQGRAVERLGVAVVLGSSRSNSPPVPATRAVRPAAGCRRRSGRSARRWSAGRSAGRVARARSATSCATGADRRVSRSPSRTPREPLDAGDGAQVRGELAWRPRRPWSRGDVGACRSRRRGPGGPGPRPCRCARRAPGGVGGGPDRPVGGGHRGIGCGRPCRSTEAVGRRRRCPAWRRRASGRSSAPGLGKVRRSAAGLRGRARAGAGRLVPPDRPPPPVVPEPPPAAAGRRIRPIRHPTPRRAPGGAPTAVGAADRVADERRDVDPGQALDRGVGLGDGPGHGLDHVRGAVVGEDRQRVDVARAVRRRRGRSPGSIARTVWMIAASLNWR